MSAGVIQDLTLQKGEFRGGALTCTGRVRSCRRTRSRSQSSQETQLSIWLPYSGPQSCRLVVHREEGAVLATVSQMSVSAAQSGYGPAAVRTRCVRVLERAVANDLHNAF